MVSSLALRPSSPESAAQHGRPGNYSILRTRSGTASPDSGRPFGVRRPSIQLAAQSLNLVGRFSLAAFMASVRSSDSSIAAFQVAM